MNFVVNLTSLILSYPCVYLSQKYDNKVLSIIGILAFATLQILLYFMSYSIFYLLIIAILFAIYRRGYWISRRYYNLKVIKNNSISVTYIFGKALDISKKNLLSVSIVLTVIVYILKINFIGYALLIISFFEGFIAKMYELSINKEFYTLSKSFEYNNYNLAYEITQNIFRTIITLIFAIFNFRLKNMIYITLIFVLIGSFLNIKGRKVKNMQN